MDQFNRSASCSTRWAFSKKIGRVRCIEFSRLNLPTHGNIQRERVVTDRIIKIDSELAVRRIAGLLPKWLAWAAAGCLLEIEIRKSEPAARTVDQNSRMWKMLGVLEKHRAPCEAKGGEPATDEGWHEHLRLKHGYIYGTRAIALPNGAGGFFLVECPNPQPTRAGAKGQMNKATHSEYTERILDALQEAGLLEQWEAQERAA
jgi:hypothetical protein